MKDLFSKKSISPVVATALLLVVAVIGVVGFNTWFTSFSSSTLTNIETQNNNFNTQIVNLIDTDLYFNSGKNNLTITDVKIGGISCNISKNLILGMNKLDLNKCSALKNSILKDIQEVVVLTNSKIYSKKYLVNNLALCQNNWLSVKGNSVLGTTNFCVMKYEAKNVGGIATSVAAGNPWININQTDSKNKCLVLGTGYHLIKDKEWVTIARLAENDKTNWNSGVVGAGYLYSGHNDAFPNNVLAADINDTNGYFGTLNSVPSNQRRTLNISGNMIWDLAGNVWEWEDEIITANSGGNLGKIGWFFREWSSISNPLNYGPSNSNFNSAQGMGQIYTGGMVGNAIHPFMRGGAYNFGINTGVYGLYLNTFTSESYPGRGFRCSFKE